MVYLYYLGIPVSFPYNYIIKEFEDFYNCHEKIMLVDIEKQSVWCGLDMFGNFLFALETNDFWLRLMYTEIYEAMYLRCSTLLNSIEPNVNVLKRWIKIIEIIVAKRNGIEFEDSMLCNSNGYYLKDLKTKYLSKKSELKNLALEGNNFNISTL